MNAYDFNVKIEKDPVLKPGKESIDYCPEIQAGWAVLLKAFMNAGLPKPVVDYVMLFDIGQELRKPDQHIYAVYAVYRMRAFSHYNVFKVKSVKDLGGLNRSVLRLYSVKGEK